MMPIFYGCDLVLRMRPLENERPYVQNLSFYSFCQLFAVTYNSTYLHYVPFTNAIRNTLVCSSPMHCVRLMDVLFASLCPMLNFWC